MSSPATPTGTRRRAALNQSATNYESGGGEGSLTGGWLGHLSGIVGDMLQGWGLLGALRNKSNNTKVTSSWTSFGGVGGGLGMSSSAVSVGHSSPCSPLLGCRGTLQPSPTGEHIEMLPIAAVNQQSQELASGAAGSRVVMRRARSCPRHEAQQSRHSYHEGTGPNSYLLTAVLIHSLKHSNNEPCESSCHICNNVPYEQLESLLTKGKLPHHQSSVDSDNVQQQQRQSRKLSPVPSVGTDGEMSEVSLRKGSVSSQSRASCNRDSVSSNRHSKVECLDSSSSQRPESSTSFYSAHEGTLTESIPGCMTNSFTDTQTGTYYPEDTASCQENSEDDDTLCEEDDFQDIDTDQELSDSNEPKEEIRMHGSPSKRARISRLGKKVGAMKLRPRQTFSEAWKGGKRPILYPLNSHDGTVSRVDRCNSLTSLPGDVRNLQHNPRLVGRFSGNFDRHDDLKDGFAVNEPGPMVLWPLRRSVSTSPTHTFFSWEENPCYLRIEGLGVGGAGHKWKETRSLGSAPSWCDTCAHLIFTAPLTCTNCSYTCHKQCQPLVAIDCRGRQSPDPQQPSSEALQTTTVTSEDNQSEEVLDEQNRKHDEVIEEENNSAVVSSKREKDLKNSDMSACSTASVTEVTSDQKKPVGEDLTSSNTEVTSESKNVEIAASGVDGEDCDKETFLPCEDNTTAKLPQLEKEEVSKVESKPPDVDDDDDDSSDYATLENDVTLTRSSEGLSTRELQRHVLLQHQHSWDNDDATVNAEGEEKHEGEEQEKDQVLVCSDESTFKRAIAGICKEDVPPEQLEAWIMDVAASQGLQVAKDAEGGYRGCLRVHLNLSRPINIVAGTRPPSIYDILQEDRTIDKTLTSFYMPRNAVKAIHITSKTTTREVIVALLRKFKVVDNPQKFALYERSYDQEETKGRLRRLGDCECPLVLAMAWSAQGLLSHRVVLQENDTADIQWDAFSLPELNNFLRILDREELDYRCQIQEKYQKLREEIQDRLERCPA